MNYSKVKEDIYNVVMLNPIHMTADEVFNKVKKLCPTIGLATVYRNLAKLVEEGRIKKLVGLGESDRYDANIKSHYHFYCQKCNKVYDLDIKEENIEKEIQSKINHKILEHNFVFYGICEDCLGGKND